MDSAFDYAHTYGMEQETAYSYSAVRGTCLYDASKVAVKITSWADVTPNSHDALQAAVAVQPVSVAIEADKAVFQLYKSGVFDNAACGTSLDHGVLVVAYGHDDTENKDFWTIKNSWGPTWGESGYIRFARTADAVEGICGVQMQPSYPIK